ncbi:MAG: helix-turn-helix transcriptional regulator [Nitrosomonadales bacterium]|nr:helix-turn-helix transcriptional regulator [Nitrosomonadales bacterium]
MEPEEALGAVLRSLRKQRGLSQEALALDAGVERNYISLIELGKNSPSIRILFKISKALDVSPSILLASVEAHIQESQKKKRQVRKADR